MKKIQDENNEGARVITLHIDFIDAQGHLAKIESNSSFYVYFYYMQECSKSIPQVCNVVTFTYAQYD